MREHGVITKIGGAMLYHNETNLIFKVAFDFLDIITFLNLRFFKKATIICRTKRANFFKFCDDFRINDL